MRKFLKVLMWIVIVIIVIVGGYIGYIYFSKGEDRDAFKMIPKDAIFIIGTNNLGEAWETLSESKMWKHLITNEYFADIHEDVAFTDSLMKDNKALDLLLKDRQMLISAHMISVKNYDFLFVVNVQKASKIAFLSEIFELFGFNVNKRAFRGEEILEMVDKTSKSVLYIAIVGNLLVGSYSCILVEDAIMEKDNENWESDTKFMEVKNEISGKKLFSFYFNYAQLSRYMKVFLSEESEITNTMSAALRYTALNVNLKDERISFSGYTNVNDSISSYAKALSNVDPGKMRAHEIISDQVALYFALCFDEFDEFFTNLKEEFSFEDSTNYEDYNRKLNRLERLLNIDLEEDFFSWIGNEIAFLKLKPTTDAREQDVVVAIHAKDIDDAKTGLDHLTRQIKRRTIVAKFESTTYQDFEIKYLDIKGFFKMFLGKLFGALEKPYFTYIEDYVVFANSSSTLMDVIDDFLKGKTLSRKESFMDFKDEFSNKANVTIFVMMPKMYQHLYHYSNAEKRKGIKENRDLILSFARVGFQLVSQNNKFKTTLIMEHDEEALLDDQLEEFESSAEELYNADYDSANFKIILTEEELGIDGPYKGYWEDSTLKYEGMIRDSMMTGLWRTYFKNKNICSAVNYKNGMVQGKALFYYNDKGQSLKAEMSFEEDKIVGIYREYYKNGARKTTLEYEDGLMNGKAEFYYQRGSTKILGKYKNGEKKGKWKYYTENGELFDKEKQRNRE